MHRKSPLNYLKADSGIAAIEIAFILPFLLFLYFGLLDLTGLISMNRKVTSAANAVADLVGQNRTEIQKSKVEDYINAVSLIMRPRPDNEVTVVVQGYRKSGASISKIWEVTNGDGPGCSGNPDTTEMEDLMDAGNDIIVAQTCTTFAPYVGTFLGTVILGATTFDLAQTAMVRPRSTLQLDCKDGTSSCT
jgi:hypothetical protein